MMNKQQLIEERRKKWMMDREVSQFQEETKKELYDSKPSSKPMERNSSITANDTEEFLSRITGKLADHIRLEIQKEMKGSMLNTDIRDSVMEKMESFLESELSTHTCKICFELMTSPDNTPILLFPCGHTFCKECVEKHQHNRSTSKINHGCPYCRTPIQSKAINQSLKELIDQFMDKRKMIAKANHLEDVFPEKNKKHDNNCNIKSTESNNKGNSSKYFSQLKSCEMRYGILKNEKEDVVFEQEKLQKKKEKIEYASNHLIKEKQKLDEKLKLILEEKELIETHLNDQFKKQEEIKNQQKQAKEKEILLSGTLSNIKKEMEKLRILAEATSNS